MIHHHRQSLHPNSSFTPHCSYRMAINLMSLCVLYHLTVSQAAALLVYRTRGKGKGRGKRRKRRRGTGMTEQTGSMLGSANMLYAKGQYKEAADLLMQVIKV